MGVTVTEVFIFEKIELENIVIDFEVENYANSFFVNYFKNDHSGSKKTMKLASGKIEFYLTKEQNVLK